MPVLTDERRPVLIYLGSVKKKQLEGMNKSAKVIIGTITFNRVFFMFASFVICGTKYTTNLFFQILSKRGETVCLLLYITPRPKTINRLLLFWLSWYIISSRL